MDLATPRLRAPGTGNGMMNQGQLNPFGAGGGLFGKAGGLLGGGIGVPGAGVSDVSESSPLLLALAKLLGQQQE